MPSLNPLDRLSLCRFTFADGRRCRTPRLSTHPNFCHYHAQLEAQSQLTTQLANDLAKLFATPNLSTTDLSAAIARLIPAVLHGHLKIRTARTVAYLLQTLLQTIRLSQPAHPSPIPPQLPPPSSTPSSSPTTEQPNVAAGSPHRPAAPTVSRCHPACPEGRRERSEGSSHDSAKPSSQSIHTALSIARQLFPPRPTAT